MYLDSRALEAYTKKEYLQKLHYFKKNKNSEEPHPKIIQTWDQILNTPFPIVYKYL